MEYWSSGVLGKTKGNHLLDRVLSITPTLQYSFAFEKFSLQSKPNMQYDNTTNTQRKPLCLTAPIAMRP